MTGRQEEGDGAHGRLWRVGAEPEDGHDTTDTQSTCHRRESATKKTKDSTVDMSWLSQPPRVWGVPAGPVMQ